MEVAQEHRSHGMQGSTVEPDWPPLTLSEVDRLLRTYPEANGAVRILTHSPRPFSAASLVQTPLGQVFVKRHHRSVRDREGLLEEHRFLSYLSDRMPSRAAGNADHATVLAALPNADGQTAIVDGEWSYEVHPVAPGVDLYREALSWTPFLTPGQAHSAGRALAQLHHAAQGYEAPPRPSQQLITSFTIFSGRDPWVAMSEYLRLRPMLENYAEERNWRSSFDELLLPIYMHLEPWLPYLQPLWTHNDFHASNMTWRSLAPDTAVSAIFDFGLTDRTNAVHDLATAIERNIIEWLRMVPSNAEPNSGIVHLDQLDALLAGYEEVRPLTREEAHALVALLPLVHCEFALSETNYFLSILGSQEKAALAYEGYFLAHAKWFKADQGSRLLLHLQQWANGKHLNGSDR